MQAVKLLLQYKADVHAEDDWRRTPLGESQTQPPDDTIKKLLATHATVGQAPDLHGAPRAPLCSVLCSKYIVTSET